jgi:dynamin 1-like protein
LEPAREMVKNLIQCELAYINTSHPDFIGGSQAIAEISARRKQRLAIAAKQPVDASVSKQTESTRTEKEKVEIEIIKILIDSYFKIVKLHVQDAVPKAIMHFLVNMSKETIQSELVKNLYKEELITELLTETDEFAIKRNTCIVYLESLKKALSIVQEVRDMEN